mgnify:CR=1 FL=1
MNQNHWASLAIALTLAGCTERRSSTGWAAEVPADATRFEPQALLLPAAPAADVTAPPEAAATAEAPPAPKAPARTYAASITEPTDGLPFIASELISDCE